MTTTFGCAGCRKRIPAHGDTTCHCSACHQSFAGLNAFDRHRTGGTCTTPDPAPTENGVGWSIDHEGVWHWGEQRTVTEWRAAMHAKGEAARTRLSRSRAA